MVYCCMQTHANTTDEHGHNISQLLTCWICDNGVSVKLRSQKLLFSTDSLVVWFDDLMQPTADIQHHNRKWLFCRGQLRTTHWHSQQLSLFFNSSHTLSMNMRRLHKYCYWYEHPFLYNRSNYGPKRNMHKPFQTLFLSYKKKRDLGPGQPYNYHTLIINLY